jgi:hypothetical protein
MTDLKNFLDMRESSAQGVVAGNNGIHKTSIPTLTRIAEVNDDPEDEECAPVYPKGKKNKKKKGKKVAATDFAPNPVDGAGQRANRGVPSRGYEVPAGGRPCHFCHLSGHWQNECPTRAQQILDNAARRQTNPDRRPKYKDHLSYVNGEQVDSFHNQGNA